MTYESLFCLPFDTCLSCKRAFPCLVSKGVSFPFQAVLCKILLIKHRRQYHDHFASMLQQKSFRSRLSHVRFFLYIMLLSSPNSPGITLNSTLGSLLLYELLDLESAELKTSENIPTLLLIGLLLSVYATDTTILFSHPKIITTPILSLHPLTLTIPSASGKP